MRTRAVAALLAVLLVSGCDKSGIEASVQPFRGASAMKLAVLGDSDSHSYGDRISFAPGSGKRGGERREATLQWTEALMRLRPRDLDPGPWGEHGSRRVVALFRWATGRPFRVPRREDFAFNFARSGAACADLAATPFGQARQLRSLVAAEPGAWQDAVVVIRIGINDLGIAESLERFAAEGPTKSNLQRADRCVAQIAESIALLDGTGVRLRFALVGILDNADWPRFHRKWQDPRALRNIRAVLDRFDEGLRRLAAGRSGSLFIDDRAWFLARWGGRGPDGRPAYRSVEAGAGLVVGLTEGDDPVNAVLADGHAGLAWNVLWARSLHDRLRETWIPGLAPIDDGELNALLRETMR